MTIDITILDCCKLRKTPYPWPNDISLCIVPLKTMEKQFVTRFKSDFTSSLFFRGWYIYIYVLKDILIAIVWRSDIHLPLTAWKRGDVRDASRLSVSWAVPGGAMGSLGFTGDPTGDWSMIFIFTKVTSWFFRLCIAALGFMVEI